MSHYFNDWYFSSGSYLLEEPGWVSIPGHPNYYIHPKGYVANEKKVLKPHKGDTKGHENVRLSKNGKVKEEYIHRLVAQAFIPKPDPEHKKIVRHLDDDVTNNNVENLAWGDQRDNHLDCVRNGNYKAVTPEDRQKSIEKTRRPIISHNLESGKERQFRSINNASRTLHLQAANIGKVLTNKRTHTGGYSFRYVEKGGIK